MSTSQPSAAPLARPRVAPSADESPVAEESLCAHAWRSLRSTVSAAATAVLDAGIAVLQRLRKQVGGAQNAGRDDGEDRPRSRTDRPGGRRDAPVEAEAEASQPRRRLRAFLVYLGVLLAGGMGGGALAYNLLEELLARKTAESLRMKATIAKHPKSIVTAEKKLAEAQAKLIEAEKKLEVSSIAETEKKLEEAQAKRVEAEKKLETSLAEYTKTAAEKQKRLDEAVKLLETIIAAERAGKAHTPGNRGSSSSAGSKAPPLKTGNCTLDSGKKADALKDCIKDFNS